MANIFAYLFFNGRCKEAMEFYKSCLGGDLNLSTYGEWPMGAQMPQEKHNQVMHSRLNAGNVQLMGADMPTNEPYKPSGTVSLCPVCDSKQEMENLFANLSVGGRVKNPLKEEFFGWYGAITDKFGFNWMFQYGTAPKM
jgi:PhnB protein